MKYAVKREAEVVHPYFTSEDMSHKDQKVQIECEGEFIFDSATKKYVPHGICQVSYVHKEEDASEEENLRHQLSFKGVAHMVKGEMHEGPAMFVRGDGFRYSFSNMLHGRPHGYGKFYNDDFAFEHVNTLNATQDVSGYAGYVGQFEDGLWQGNMGRFYFSDGRIFTGKWEKDLMKSGTLSILKEDDNREIYQVEYDVDGDFDIGRGCDEQEPVVQTK